MNQTDPTAARQPAYDAVFAYIRQQPRDFLPTNIVDRNAMIWRAVNTALDAVASPPTDRTPLRDRIAQALIARIKQSVVPRPEPWGGQVGSLLAATEYDLADAVLAVLPEQADRAAVLLWAADQIDAETRQLKTDGVLEPDKFRPCRDASAQLRRLAVEAHGTGTQQQPAASPRNRRALVHNAITNALSAAGDWVPLSVRIAATRAALAEVDAWHADDPTPAGAQQQTEGAAPGEVLDLSDGPIRCPLCPNTVTLHTLAGARAHFTVVHPEQRLTGRGPGPWPRPVTAGAGAQQQPDTEARAVPLTGCNSGPGWYEVINPRNATTNIAYVHEDGYLYLPEGDGLTPDEFAFAAARGNAHRLVRADEETDRG